MSDKHVEVDARGLSCPQPVINTKKALDGLTRGTVTVIVDNDTARENVLKFAASQGCGAVLTRQDGNCYIRITKDPPGAVPDRPLPRETPPGRCICAQKIPWVRAATNWAAF